MRILLVEDDAIIGDALVAGLKNEGFTVDWLQDGTLAKDSLDENMHDIVILDLTLPGMDGLEVLKRWRKSGTTLPVIVLTARGTVSQRIEGLSLGADDYLPKPFALDELVARVRVWQRRATGQAHLIMQHEDIAFDPQKRIVTKGSTTITLSPKSLILLETFLTHKGRILSKDTLREKLYGWNDDVSSNTVEVHIHHLRSKLGKDFIKNVHGVGYILGTT